MVTPPVPGSVVLRNTAPEAIDIPKAKGWRRIKEVFVAEDLGTVKGKIFEGVVVPSIKDFIVTIVCDTVSLIFYGEKAVNAKRSFTSKFLSGSGNRISYSTYFASSVNGDQSIQQKLAPNMITGYTEPLFTSFEDAKDCLSDLVEMLDQYPQVTISDLYSHSCVAKNGYRNEAVYNNWGWKNLGNAHVTLTPNGYTLNLPKPKPLD